MAADEINLPEAGADLKEIIRRAAKALGPNASPDLRRILGRDARAAVKRWDDQGDKQAGEQLKAIIESAVAVLGAKDSTELWQILDRDAASVIRRWDGLLGRSVPTLDELAQGRAHLIGALLSTP